MSQRGTHEALPRGGLRLALGLYQWYVPARWLDCKCSTTSGPSPRASSATAGMIGRDAMGQGQGVRAGEPVRAHESRCSGAPLLTRKRFACKRRGPRSAADDNHEAKVRPRGANSYRQMRRSKCHWVCPEQPGDNAARGAPPIKHMNIISKMDTCRRDGPTRPGNDAAMWALPAKNGT